eukprot:250882_1
MDKHFETKHISNDHYEFLNNMIHHHLQINKFKNDYARYMNDVFWMFCHQKTQIVLNLDEINRNLFLLQDVIMDVKTNLFKKMLFSLFKNVNKYQIYTTSFDGNQRYEINLELLLKLIRCVNAPNDLKIILHAVNIYNRKDKEHSWIQKSLILLESEFNKNGWKCDFQSMMMNDKRSDKLTIFRDNSAAFDMEQYKPRQKQPIKNMEKLEKLTMQTQEQFKQSVSSNCEDDYICRYTCRIVAAMKHYQTLDIDNIETDRNKLEEFYDKTYKHILHDFTHVISHHPKTLHEMYDFAVQNRNLQKCDVKNCARLSRHNREREPNDKIEEFKTEEEMIFGFKRDMMDGIHCYLLHQYDLGQAIYKKEELIQSSV